MAACLPGVAADAFTQASQAGVRLLPARQGGLVVTAWARRHRGRRARHNRRVIA